MELPKRYFEFLTLAGEAFNSYHIRTGSTAVIVGGAATAILTDGKFMSQDLDVILFKDDIFRDIMLEHGFQNNGSGLHRTNSYFHPDYSEFYIELVSGSLFDGLADRNRLISFTIHAESSIVIPSVEDMIADRLGAYSISQSDTSRLEQARLLFNIHKFLDETYLHKRIDDEGGDINLLTQ